MVLENTLTIENRIFLCDHILTLKLTIVTYPRL